MHNRWYLAIDLGTGGSKVAVVSEDGQVLSSAFRSIDTVLTDDGGAEQDPAQWWQGLTGAIREVVTACGQNTPCSGVGITGQWGSTVPVDSAGTALGPCLLWSDTRGGTWSRPLVGGALKVAGYAPHKIAQWLRLAGGAPSPAGADPTGHAQFLQHRRADVFRSAHALIEPMDYIGARLTGRVA